MSLHCRIVLVRPEVAANIGSAARVMRNFGLRELVLVAPVAHPLDEQARALATHHAFDLLQSARIVPDLDAALVDCLAAAATSARTGGLYRRQTVGEPDEILPRLAEVGRSGPVALVFGPEPSGLSNAEVMRCHHQITIPASEEYPVLNLAQAVAVCAYEWHKAVRSVSQDEGERAAVPFEMQERMFAALREGLDDIGYLRGPGGEALMFAIRHLLARAQPNEMEVRLLFGLARQLQWVAQRPSSSPNSRSV